LHTTVAITARRANARLIHRRTTVSETDQNVIGRPEPVTPPQEQPAWGAPQTADAPGPRWSGRKTVAAVAVAVGIAAAGGTAIYAANGTTSSTQQDGRGGFPGGPGGGSAGRGMGAFGNTAHGEFQTGSVTEVSPASITVKSTDGYTRTYTVDSSTVISGGGPNAATATITSIATGDTVTVVATTDSGTPKAASISDRGDAQMQPGVAPRGGAGQTAG
jgi:hypothetical protein